MPCWRGVCISVCSHGVILCPDSCRPGQAPNLLGLAEEQGGGKVAPSFGTAQNIFTQGLQGVWRAG